MSESNGPTASPPPAGGFFRSRRRLITGSIVGLLAVLVGAKAYVQARGVWHHGWGGPMSAEMMNERIEHGVKWMLSDIDATPEQKEQVTSILKAAAGDVRALHDRHLATRKALREILTAPSIDRARLESVRADGLSLADEASKRILQAMADAAEVLTPEQRAALAARIEEHRRWRHGDQ